MVMNHVLACFWILGRWHAWKGHGDGGKLIYCELGLIISELHDYTLEEIHRNPAAVYFGWIYSDHMKMTSTIDGFWIV